MFLGLFEQGLEMIYCFTYKNTMTFAKVIQVTIPIRFQQHLKYVDWVVKPDTPYLQSIHNLSATLSFRVPKLLDIRIKCKHLAQYLANLMHFKLVFLLC